MKTDLLPAKVSLAVLCKDGMPVTAIDPHEARYSRKSPNVKSGFTLIEILIVMSVVSILVGLTTLTILGLRPPGSRQGALLQISGTIEEARMRAIEQQTTIYVGLAGSSHSDSEKRMRAYIVFREYTAEEKASQPVPQPANSFHPLTEWDALPKGYYWDASPLDSLFQSTTALREVKDLAGCSGKLHILAFGPLGQLIEPSASSPKISMIEGAFDPESGKVVKQPNSSPLGLAVQVNRLTGRVRQVDPPVSQ